MASRRCSTAAHYELQPRAIPSTETDAAPVTRPARTQVAMRAEPTSTVTPPADAEGSRVVASSLPGQRAPPDAAAAAPRLQ
eukprot:jgi/Tetstr1/442595/TSEL_030691.t1